jgi:DoxX-like family
VSANLTRVSIPLLRWTLGLVVMLQSFEFVFSTSAAHFLAQAGLSAWLRPVLGGSEIIAAVLFLVPFTAAIGGYLLLVIFGLAALLHILHGQYGVEGLLVYAVAVLVSMTHTKNKTAETGHGRL